MPIHNSIEQARIEDIIHKIDAFQDSPEGRMWLERVRCEQATCIRGVFTTPPAKIELPAVIRAVATYQALEKAAKLFDDIKQELKDHA
ncbi:MAG: hypothetical protein N2111_13905 [Candidatus Sumerlaeaceae bacterium]|nr:hypothetical protein [Candidatus Sumerlaeaceae bacterium]